MSGREPDVRAVRCPGCREVCEYSQRNRFRPFCSDRCKSGDFGAWASEHYRIAARPTTASGEDEADADEAGPH